MSRILLLIIGVLSLSSSAYADTIPHGTYIGVSGAFINYPEYKPKPNGGRDEPIGIDRVHDGYGMGANVGYKINDNFRAEIDYNYRKNVFKSFVLLKDVPEKNFKKGQVVTLGKKFGYVHSHTVMINGYYDLVNSTDFTPFLGLGLGVTKYEERNECGNYSTYSPSAQITTGVAYKIDDVVSINAGYRHFHMKDTKIKNECLSPKIKYRTNEGFLGVQYQL